MTAGPLYRFASTLLMVRGRLSPGSVARLFVTVWCVVGFLDIHVVFTGFGRLYTTLILVWVVLIRQSGMCIAFSIVLRHQGMIAVMPGLETTRMALGARAGLTLFSAVSTVVTTRNAVTALDTYTTGRVGRTAFNELRKIL
jgi:hypothetical protein